MGTNWDEVGDMADAALEAYGREQADAAYRAKFTAEGPLLPPAHVQFFIFVNESNRSERSQPHPLV
jgi:hypothetical protein